MSKEIDKEIDFLLGNLVSPKGTRPTFLTHTIWLGRDILWTINRGKITPKYQDLYFSLDGCYARGTRDGLTLGFSLDKFKPIVKPVFYLFGEYHILAWMKTLAHYRPLEEIKEETHILPFDVSGLTLVWEAEVVLRTEIRDIVKVIPEIEMRKTDWYVVRKVPGVGKKWLEYIRGCLGEYREKLALPTTDFQRAIYSSLAWRRDKDILSGEELRRLREHAMEYNEIVAKEFNIKLDEVLEITEKWIKETWKEKIPAGFDVWWK